MICTNCKTETSLEQLQKLNRQIPLKNKLNNPTNYLTCPTCNETLFESGHLDHQFRVEAKYI